MLKRIIGRFYKSDVTSAPHSAHGPEVAHVAQRRVSCSGPEFSGHPQVWLTILEEHDQTYCPYCSKLFKYRPLPE